MIILNFIISNRGGLAPSVQVLSYPLHVYVCPQSTVPYVTLLSLRTHNFIFCDLFLL
jgi:hypothetical protein